MRRMRDEFQCDTCETWAQCTITIAENIQEFYHLHSHMPVGTTQIGFKLIVGHDCPAYGCTGRINVVYAIADFAVPETTEIINFLAE